LIHVALCSCELKVPLLQTMLTQSAHSALSLLKGVHTSCRSHLKAPCVVKTMMTRKTMVVGRAIGVMTVRKMKMLRVMTTEMVSLP